MIWVRWDWKRSICSI